MCVCVCVSNFGGFRQLPRSDMSSQSNCLCVCVCEVKLRVWRAVEVRYIFLSTHLKPGGKLDPQLIVSIPGLYFLFKQVFTNPETP